MSNFFDEPFGIKLTSLNKILEILMATEILFSELIATEQDLGSLLI